MLQGLMKFRQFYYEELRSGQLWSKKTSSRRYYTLFTRSKCRCGQVRNLIGSASLKKLLKLKCY